MSKGDGRNANEFRECYLLVQFGGVTHMAFSSCPWGDQLVNQHEVRRWFRNRFGDAGFWGRLTYRWA